MNPSELAAQFPIQSQTSDSDKAFLLGAMDVVRSFGSAYDYLEIGSFLGGSLAPFLRDTACRSIVSIDDRGKVLPDERGISFDYGGVTAGTMLNKLQEAGLDTAKLQTFDGAIENWKPGTARFDLAFIDGEHTDVACFRDCLWTLPVLKENAVLMFHDSTLIHKAIRLLLVYLGKQGADFTFVKRRDSEMSGLIFGALQVLDVEHYLGPLQDPGEFFSQAEAALLTIQINSRVEVSLSVKPASVYKVI